MSDQFCANPPSAHASHPSSSIPHPPPSPPDIWTLWPLSGAGQAALAPDSAAGVLGSTLVGLVTRWNNAHNEVVTRTADDLFACAARDGACYDVVPKGADLIHATFNFQLAGLPGPHLVDISPPHCPSFHNPGDADRILPLLAQRGFKVTPPPINSCQLA